MIGLVAVTVAQTVMAMHEEQLAFNAYMRTLSPGEKERALALREKQRQERIEAARHAELVEAAKPKGMSAAMGFFLGWLIFN